MPIIQAKVVGSRKSRHYCESCGKIIRGRKVCLFGMAENGDKPYWAYWHFDCVKDDVGLHPANAKMDAVILDELQRTVGG